MQTINDVKQTLSVLRSQLANLEGFENNFDYDENSPDEELMADKVNDCLQLAGRLDRRIDALFKDVAAEGFVSLNQDGHYEVNGFELTAGRIIEYWDKANEQWHEDRVEYFNDSYGLYYSQKKKLKNMYIRVRKH